MSSFIKALAAIAIALTILPAQSQQLKGKIIDAITKEPLSGASVHCTSQNCTCGCAANAAGEFELKTKENCCTSFAVSSVGYQPLIIQSAKLTTLVSLQPSNSIMEAIVVTANRGNAKRSDVPMAISKLSAKTIDEAKATAVYELVNKVPGVVMVNLNNEQHGMSIRQPMGTSAYYLYMEDGIGIRPMGVFNHNALLEVNQFAINSVEVVKGPVSSIYGPEAVGGAINFVTHKPTAVPTGKLGIQFDNYGYKRVQLAGGARIKKFGFYLAGMSSWQRDSWMTNSDYDKNTINARMEYNFTDRIRLIFSGQYGKYYSSTGGSVDSMAFYSRAYVSTTDFTYRKSTASRNRLTLEHDWNKGSQSFITLFHRFNEHGQNPSYGIRWTSGQTSAKGEINSSDFRSYGVLAQHTQQFNFLQSKLLLGSMYDYSPNEYYSYVIELAAKLRPDGRSVEKYSITNERPDLLNAKYDAKIKNAAAYLQYDFTPVSKLKVSAGLRYDQMSFSYNNFLDSSSGSKSYSRITPKVGVTYEVQKNLHFYGNYAQGFSPPGLTSIFRKRPNTNPAEFYYNLEPAYFENYEIGTWISFLENKVAIDIALYQMNGRNELLNIRQPDNSFDYQSAGKTLHRGIEFGVRCIPSKQFNLRFGGTNALHRFEEFLVSTKPTDPVKNLNGFEMPGSPRWTWNTELTYYPKWLTNFRTAIEWQHSDSWYQNQINTVTMKGFDVLNFRVGYQWKGIEVFSNIMNLTDALYANNATRGNNATDRTTYTPAAPRTFVFGLQYNLAGKK